MLSGFLQQLQQLLDFLRCWVVISPFEQAIRIRLGRHVKLLGSGLHWRLPWLDVVCIQNVRMRISSLGRQTVTTRDGQTITFSGSVGYAIGDIAQLYQTLHHAEDTIAYLVRSTVADYISTHDETECHPSTVQEAVTAALSLSNYGLRDVRFFMTEFVRVRTFRLIGDYTGHGSCGDALSTQTADTRSGLPR